MNEFGEAGCLYSRRRRVPSLKGPVRLPPEGPPRGYRQRPKGARTMNLRQGQRSEGVTPLEAWIHASAGSVRRNNDEYRNAMGDWIGQLGNWTLFVTRTLGDQSVSEGEPSVATARSCLRELLLRSEARKFACVFELQKRGVYHLHALLETAKPFRLFDEQERDMRLWGISRWKVFTPGGGAPGYIGKYLTKAAVEMYVGLDGPYTEGRLKGTHIGNTRV